MEGNGYNVYILELAIFCIGLYGVIASGHLMKRLFGLSIMQTSIIMLYISIGYRGTAASSPVYKAGVTLYTNPLPQVLMLTAIVVGVSVTSVGLAILIRIHKKFKTVYSKSIDEKCSYDVSYVESEDTK